MTTETITCSTCDGSGTVPFDSVCPTCKGSGTIPRNRLTLGNQKRVWNIPAPPSDKAIRLFGLAYTLIGFVIGLFCGILLGKTF